MKLHYYLGAIALALVTSCVQEQYVVEDMTSAPDFEVIASLEDEAQTRTQLSEDGLKVLWSKGDEISVLNDGSLYKYTVKAGEEGKTVAQFKYHPDSEVVGSTGDGVGSDVFVAVYPYTTEASVEVSENGYTVSTVIPAKQTYAVNSYGDNSSPMVAVNELRPSFSFKNVGSMLKMPLVCAEGESVTIMTATLESKNHKIAGAATVTMEGGEPTSVVATGESTITITCGEDGVVLDPVTPTNFFFVLAPGTYEANDLTLKFTDSLGNYFETKISAENTFVRSKGVGFKTRTFDVTGLEAIDLWVKAIAEAYVEAERIVPTITSISKVYNWVKALAENPDVERLLQEAATLITLGQYELAYDLLNGVPGFERQYNHVEAVGSSIVKVSPDGMDTFKSLLSDIEKINSASDLIKFLDEYERMYEASGIKGQLNSTIGTIGEYIKDPSLILGLIQGDKSDNETEEDALQAYRDNLKSQLSNQITLCEGALKLLGLSSLAEKRYAEEIKQIEGFVASANALIADMDNLSKSQIQSRVKSIDSINVQLQTLSSLLSYVPDSWLEAIKISRKDIEKYTVIKIDPTTFLGDAEDVFDNILEGSIFNNGVFDAFVDVIIDEILSYNFVETLEAALNSEDTGDITIEEIVAAINITDPDASAAAQEAIKNKLTKKTVEYLFSQPEFKQMLIDALREIVKQYEDTAISEAIKNNQTLRDQAIALAKSTAITNARVKATYKIDSALQADNEANLNSGAWGMFKKVLNNKKCVDVFTDLGLLDVYNVLTEFVAVVDSIYTFEIKPNEAGEKYNYYKEPADYEQDVDWWLLTFVDSSEEVDE